MLFLTISGGLRPVFKLVAGFEDMKELLYIINGDGWIRWMTWLLSF
jgi:hypothetical protein